MSIPTSIGFPRMLEEEEAEKRVFLTKFIYWLSKMGMDISLEKGSGKKLRLNLRDYQLDEENIF